MLDGGVRKGVGRKVACRPSHLVKSQKILQPTSQQVKDHQLAARSDIGFELVHMGIGYNFVVGEDGHPAPGKIALFDGKIIDDIAN